MARARSVDDDALEPILPRHPPTAPPEGGEPAVVDAVGSGPSDDVAGRRPWEHWLLLGCAVVATLALLVCAVRLTAIARDQKAAACRERVFVEEQLRNGRGDGERDFRERLAACVGVDLDAGPDSD